MLMCFTSFGQGFDILGSFFVNSYHKRREWYKGGENALLSQKGGKVYPYILFEQLMCLLSNNMEIQAYA